MSEPTVSALAADLAAQVDRMRDAAENLKEAERNHRDARRTHDSAVRNVRSARAALDAAITTAGLPEESKPQPVEEA